MATLKIDGEDAVPLHAGRTRIGSAADADVVVTGHGIAGEHVIVQRTAQGYRALAAKGVPGIVVNGARCARADLGDGDTIELGACRIVFGETAADDTAAGAVVDATARVDAMARELAIRPRRPRAAAEPGDRDGRASPPRRRAPWLAVSAVLMSLVVLGYALLRLRDARQRIALEQEQAQQPGARSNPQQSEQSEVAAARVDIQSLKNFERAYLLRDPTRRPAARELVRRADAWLARYGALFATEPRRVQDRSEVEALRQRYAPAAALGAPDGVEDVVFRARHQARLRPRRYRDALAILDDYLVTAPADADTDAVMRTREELEREAAGWFERHRERIRVLVRRGDRATARADLQHLRAHGLAAWGVQLAELEALLADG